MLPRAMTPGRCRWDDVGRPVGAEWMRPGRCPWVSVDRPYRAYWRVYGWGCGTELFDFGG